MPKYISVVEEHADDLKKALIACGGVAVASYNDVHDYLKNKGIIPKEHKSESTIPENHKHAVLSA